jgi:uncharacterized protein with NAD-binding domain and iron-sulfur cluster
MKKIIIVGGGITGLTCAHKLVNKGFEVELYEKEDVLGGMARGKRNDEGIPIEHSWRGFGPFYHNLYGIMKEIPSEMEEYFSDGYSIEEVKKHNSRNSLWTYYENNVYDLTDYIDSHPGGSIILNSGGKNLSETWDEFNVGWHKKDSSILEYLEKYKIGSLLENFENKKTVYDNLNKEQLHFYLFSNNDEEYKLPNISFKDYIYLTYLYLKISSSNSRKEIYMEEKLTDYIKNKVCKNTYNYLVDFLSGPGYGFDINTLSVGHFFLFIEYCLNENQKFSYWRSLNGPINETWFEPWKKYLESKGVKINLNSKLTKINHKDNKIENINIKFKDNKIFNFQADEYIICINPESLINILFDSNLYNIANKHIKYSTVNNQVSFRIGLRKKINLKKMSGIILLDSPYNITLHSYQDHWNEKYDLGMNGEIKTLISGTLVRTYKKGSLFKKSALSLTEKELLQEIIHQILESKQFINFIKENNNKYILDEKDIIHKSIFEDWYMKDGRLKVENKKWINTIKNEKNRVDNLTKFDNLFIGGSHTKTSTNIWLMEGAAESGLMVTNLILEKYQKNKLNIVTHKSSVLIGLLKMLDDLLYFFNATNIIDLLIILLVIYTIYKLTKK